MMMMVCVVTLFSTDLLILLKTLCQSRTSQSMQHENKKILIHKCANVIGLPLNTVKKAKQCTTSLDFTIARNHIGVVIFYIK